MTDSKTLSSSAMDSLRRKYAERLRVRESEIEELMTLAASQKLTAEERALLQNHGHSLAGSGATYGYPDISKAGRALEQAVETGAAELVFIPLIQTLLATCRSVSATQAPVSVPDGISVLRKKKSSKTKKTLLIVDDDHSVHELVGEIFKNDIRVISAHTGQDGLELIRGQKPDLVLLDGAMPGMKGMTLLETLHQDAELKKTPVIMLTAHDQNSYVAKAIMTGALGYIVKPFKPADLAARVRTLFTRFDTTILIADDDASIQDLLWHKFRATGVNVVQATDGEAALALAMKHKPKLAIVDWMMPGLDGLALMHKLKKTPETKNTKIIMLTVKHQEHDILEGLKLGAEDYIIKPFISEEVVMRCFRLLGFNGTPGA